MKILTHRKTPSHAAESSANKRKQDRLYPLVLKGYYAHYERLGVIFKSVTRQSIGVSLDAQEIKLPILSPQDIRLHESLRRDLRAATQEISRQKSRYRRGYTHTRLRIRSAEEDERRRKSDIRIFKQRITNETPKTVFTAVSAGNGRILLPLDLTQTTQILSLLARGKHLELHFDEEKKPALYRLAPAAEIKPRRQMTFGKGQ